MKVWSFVTLSRLLYDFPFILCKRIQSLLFYNLFRILKVVQCVPAKSLILSVSLADNKTMKCSEFCAYLCPLIRVFDILTL